MTLEELITHDNARLDILRTVRELNLPDAFVAAGFVRNAVWDYLHSYQPTALNDVDVIYFDPEHSNPDSHYEQHLLQQRANVNWQVKNQAAMHIRNGDRPYQNSPHAMTFWPEKETAVAVRLSDSDQLIFAAPFGTDFLFDGRITHNPARSLEVFQERVTSKGWLETWPMLQLSF